MAQEFFGYFDSATGDTRSYAAEQLSKVFRALAADGVSEENGLAVQAEGATLRTTVAPGLALIQGFLYELKDDGGAVKAFTHAPSGTAPRVDRVVIKLDTDSRAISMYVKTGVAAANPIPPALTRSGAVYEISLARVTIRANADAIAATDIMDERWDEAVCGACIPALLRKSVLDTRYGALATPSRAGLISPSQFTGLSTLLSAISASATAVDLGGRYLDNALFR